MLNLTISNSSSMTMQIDFQLCTYSEYYTCLLYTDTTHIKGSLMYCSKNQKTVKFSSFSFFSTFKPLSDQVMRYPCFSFMETSYFHLWVLYKSDLRISRYEHNGVIIRLEHISSKKKTVFSILLIRRSFQGYRCKPVFKWRVT